MNWNNKCALLTGASSGIGMELAKQLSAKGVNLILVARREDRLRALQKELKTECEVYPMDLSKEEEVYRLVTMMNGRKIDVLLNCAGYGIIGATTTNELAKEIDMLELNCRAVHILTRSFLPQMLERDEGILLNIASCAGLLPGGPFLAGYYATKAYVASYTQALAAELAAKQSKVKVCALCPGPVYTEFTKVAGGNEWATGINAERCAQVCIRGMERGKRVIVPGFIIKLGVACARLVPRRFVIWLIGKGQGSRLQKSK